MKIIQVMPEFGLAGAETMCENLTIQLKKLGHEAIVISMYDYHSAITQRLEDAGIRVIYLDKKPGLDFSMIVKMKKVFKEEKPDVIHTHRYVMQYAIPAAIMAGVKRRVHTVHNVAQMENTGMAQKLNYLFYKFNNVTPVALSSEVQKTIEEVYKIRCNDIPVIFNGIDLSKCKLKLDYKLSDTYNVLHIGRFAPQKNHLGLIDAFAEFVKVRPNAVLSLIGDGDLKTEVENRVLEQKIENNVKFLGLQNNVYPFLQQADTFILPSNYEGVPMTLIEAMGSGLPIIASNVGGIPDMLHNNESALLINADKAEISEALVKMMSDEELRARLGKAAKQASAKFSVEEMAENYLEVYKSE